MCPERERERERTYSFDCHCWHSRMSIVIFFRCKQEGGITTGVGNRSQRFSWRQKNNPKYTPLELLLEKRDLPKGQHPVSPLHNTLAGTQNLWCKANHLSMKKRKCRETERDREKKPVLLSPLLVTESGAVASSCCCCCCCRRPKNEE
jgi:hypothetical protein